MRRSTTPSADQLDTGNVYYYERGHRQRRRTGKAHRLRRVAVHLKETNGGFKTWHFPALGQGIVDFPGIFRLLAARGFHGPFTMEIEGIEGIKWDQAAQLKAIGFGRLSAADRRDGLNRTSSRARPVCHPICSGSG